VKLPLAVKLHPHFSAFGDMAWQLKEAGANGLVLFNRVYQPDIDLVRLKWDTELALSDPSEIRLGLLWISVLSGRLGHASLAASTGVETSDEVIKYLLAGADVVMTASSLLRRGPRHVRHLIAGLETWLSRRGFESVAAIKGLMRPTHPDTEMEGHERGDYVTGLSGYRGPYVRH
jgi:dihydroorotate dehydrogenase (fumarate)